MRADAPATCAPLAPRGGGTPLRDKRSPVHYSTTERKQNCESNNILSQTTCENKEDKESKGDDGSISPNYKVLCSTKRSKLVDCKDTIVNKPMQLSYIRIDTSELSEILSHSHCDDNAVQYRSSPNHNNGDCENSILLSQSSATIINTDDTNYNNDCVSDDYTIPSSSSTSESERIFDNIKHETNKNYYEIDNARKLCDNPSTSYHSSNKEMECRSSCESIQDIESDNNNVQYYDSNMFTRFDEKYDKSDKSNDERSRTMEVPKNKSVIESCEPSWSIAKRRKCKNDIYQKIISDSEFNNDIYSRSQLSKDETFSNNNITSEVNGKESENNNSYSSLDNGNHNYNPNDNRSATHYVESDTSLYGFSYTKKGNRTIDTKQYTIQSTSNKWSDSECMRVSQNIIRPSDNRSVEYPETVFSLSSTRRQHDNVDEIISVDTVNNKIYTVSELLDNASYNKSTSQKPHGTDTASIISNTYRRIPKSQSCVEYASVVQRKNQFTDIERNTERPKSTVGRRVTIRHRDAEEALSSLLWQPYECRDEAVEWGGAVSSGASRAGAGAYAHSLLGVRDGETRAAVMRLTVPAPPLCRAAQPATGIEPKQVAINGEPKHGENSAITNNINESVVSVNNENIGVVNNSHNNRVSVNGEVIGCDVISADIVRDVEAQHHAPRRSWTSCGAQTEEAMVGGGPPQAPPPYSTLPPPHAHHPHPLPVPLPMQSHAYPFQPVSLRRCQYGEDSEPPKTCCGAIGTRTIGLKWFIVLVALAGICCVLVGTVLGAVRAQGRAHLTVLLLMIGVGLVLVTVSGVAWRAISRRRSRNAASRAASSPAGTSRRGAGGASCMRAHHPYAAMLYPEFHCRPPPPSYQASMHEYRLRLLLLDRAASPPPLACPPPAYRPRPRGMVGGPGPYMGRGTRGRRRPEVRTTAAPLSAVVIQNIGLEPYDDIKYDDVQEMEPPIVSDSKEEEVQENKEGNLVTIVQTGEDTSPVIVTVSGSMPEERTNQTTTSEIDILAHL